MTTCLYIGRFQPVHSGHLDVLNQIFDYGIRQIIIGVGSSNKIDKQNPFTFPQRKHLLTLALEDRHIDMATIDIVGIPDFTQDEDWYAYITEMFSFDVVMSGNPRVRNIFSVQGHEVLEERERIPIHATDIRAMLATHQWSEVQQRVTPSVFAWLQEQSLSH